MTKKLRPNYDLKDAIARSGKKQNVIARAAGIDETRLSHIVRGRLQANQKERAALARATGVPVRRIFLPALDEGTAA